VIYISSSKLIVGRTAELGIKYGSQKCTLNSVKNSRYEKVYYIEYIIRTLGIIHAIISFCMLIATAVLIVYYNLEVTRGKSSARGRWL
jgi:hypothetical protein